MDANTGPRSGEWMISWKLIHPSIHPSLRLDLGELTWTKFQEEGAHTRNVHVATDSAEESGRTWAPPVRLWHLCHLARPFGLSPSGRASLPPLLWLLPTLPSLGSRSLQDISSPFACHLIMSLLSEYHEPINSICFINELVLTFRFTFRYFLPYVQEEPAVSCTWTGWDREMTGWSSRLQEIYPSYKRDLVEYTSHE